MKLLGKKFNDIWYKGTLIDILNKEKPRDQVSNGYNRVTHSEAFLGFLNTGLGFAFKFVGDK